ncbi:hypothetical protein S7335_5230 [Synechococcus sp. PCC 7335]|nr:hypothetical protein S7335_5230 [Synechococcus sp. PCC 7335]
MSVPRRQRLSVAKTRTGILAQAKESNYIEETLLEIAITVAGQRRFFTELSPCRLPSLARRIATQSYKVYIPYHL